MRKIKSQILVIFFSFLPSLYAEVWFGCGWPYVGLKYNFSKPFASEIKYATGEGINAYAGRFYWNYYCEKRLKGFLGLEYGYITFNSLDIKGTGYEASVFIGGEYFFSKRLSLSLDLSPTFINLKSSKESVSGIEWVTNFAIYWRLFGK